MKLKADILKPDNRYLNEGRVDKVTGKFRRLVMDDLYDDMAAFEFKPHVPPDIAHQFGIARSAYLYSWFDYEMITLAEEHAYTVLEMAIRRRAKLDNTGMDEKTGMRGAIDHARARGWLSDADYGEMETGGAPIPFLHLLPKMRNDLLHGNPRLSAAASFQILEITFEMVVKLFPPAVAAHG